MESFLNWMEQNKQECPICHEKVDELKELKIGKTSHGLFCKKCYKAELEHHDDNLK